MRIKTVQQKTFLCANEKIMDDACNQFRIDHPKFNWKGTTIQHIPDTEANIMFFMATIFWEEYKEVKD